MDIKELKEKKERLEEEITNLINKFEEETETSIEDLQLIQHVIGTDYSKTVPKALRLIEVNVKVKII